MVIFKVPWLGLEMGSQFNEQQAQLPPEQPAQPPPRLRVCPPSDEKAANVEMALSTRELPQLGHGGLRSESLKRTSFSKRLWQSGQRYS